MSQCDGKIKHATERTALNELKRFRQNRHLGGHRVDDLNVYLCPRCHFWHLGRDTNRIRERATKVSPGEIRKLKHRLEDAGRRIAKDDARVAKKKIAELAPIVAEDQLWLKAIEDAARFHIECAEALNRIIDEHFSRR